MTPSEQNAWATEEALQQTWDPRLSRSSSLHWIQHPDSLHLFVGHCHTLAKCCIATLPICVPKLTGIDSLRNRFQTSTVLLVKIWYVGTWTANFSVFIHHFSSCFIHHFWTTILLFNSSSWSSQVQAPGDQRWCTADHFDSDLDESSSG